MSTDHRRLDHQTCFMPLKRNDSARRRASALIGGCEYRPELKTRVHLTPKLDTAPRHRAGTVQQPHSNNNAIAKHDASQQASAKNNQMSDAVDPVRSLFAPLRFVHTMQSDNAMHAGRREGPDNHGRTKRVSPTVLSRASTNRLLCAQKALRPLARRARVFWCWPTDASLARALASAVRAPQIAGGVPPGCG